MGAKAQALKNAARLRAAKTGQSYEAALGDVRREYEQGGADEPPHTPPPAADPYEYRPLRSVTGYMFAWGVQELIGEDGMKQLADHAEATIQPEADPIVCHLCDQPIDVQREELVHVGIVLREVQPADAAVTELQMPVWTHEACDQTRVWSWAELTEIRHRAGLPVDAADRPPRVRKRGTSDFYLFTVTASGEAVFYLQPGDPHAYGPLGFRAEMLSAGFPALDLTREKPRPLPEWSITTKDDTIVSIQRHTTRWYQSAEPPQADPKWWAAVRRNQNAIFLTAPAGTVPTATLTSNASLTPLGPAGQQDLLFGGLIEVNGL
jgi:hypothetical protein